MAVFELSAAYFPGSAIRNCSVGQVLYSLGRGTTPVYYGLCLSHSVIPFPYPWWRGWTFYHIHPTFLRSYFLHDGPFRTSVSWAFVPNGGAGPLLYFLIFVSSDTARA